MAGRVPATPCAQAGLSYKKTVVINYLQSCVVPTIVPTTNMPSVHKDYRGKTPFWIGAYIDEFGRRRKQSTKTEDKRQAKAIIEGWQRAADLARAGRLTESKAREVVNDILERTGKKRNLCTDSAALPGRLAQER